MAAAERDTPHSESLSPAEARAASLLLFACLTVDLLGYGLLIPLLPFMALQLGAMPLEVALLMATFSAIQLFSAPLWGRVSDRYGRKPVLLINFAASVVAFCILANAGSLLWLFIARALAGAASGDIVAAPAYVADVTPPKKRAKRLGLIGASFGIAFTLGPLTSGILLSVSGGTLDIHALSYVAAALSSLAFLLALARLREPARDLRRARPARRSEQPVFARWLAELHYPLLPVVTAILFLVSFVFAEVESTLAVFTDKVLAWGPRDVGYLMAYGGVIAVICQLALLAPLVRRYGEARLVLIAAVLLGIGAGLISQAGNSPLLILAIGLFAAGFGLGTPSIQSLITKLSRGEATGSALGLGQATVSFARVLGPASAGFLFERIGPGAPYAAGALIMLAAVALATALQRRLEVH